MTLSSPQLPFLLGGHSPALNCLWDIPIWPSEASLFIWGQGGPRRARGLVTLPGFADSILPPRLSTPTNHLGEPPWVATIKLAGSLVAGLEHYDLQATHSN